MHFEKELHQRDSMNDIHLVLSTHHVFSVLQISIGKHPGALQGLVRLLSKDVNSQTRCSAAWALVHLAEAVDNKVAIVSIPGAVEGLVGLLDPNESSQNYRDMQQHATWTWRNLSAAWALGSLAEVEANKAIVASCPGTSQIGDNYSHFCCMVI